MDRATDAKSERSLTGVSLSHSVCPSLSLFLPVYLSLPFSLSLSLPVCPSFSLCISLTSSLYLSLSPSLSPLPFSLSLYISISISSLPLSDRSEEHTSALQSHLNL